MTTTIKRFLVSKFSRKNAKARFLAELREKMKEVEYNTKGLPVSFAGKVHSIRGTKLSRSKEE